MTRRLRSTTVRRALATFSERSTQTALQGWIMRAKFECARPVAAFGTQWTCWLSVHFVENDSPRNQLMVSVCFQPDCLSASDDARLRELGWYSEVRRELRKLGYRGNWWRDPLHPGGEFWKRGLTSGAAALREVHVLDALKLAAPLPEESKAATRSPASRVSRRSSSAPSTRRRR